ncbi:organic hydroperoxide resistance protein [Virgibacillus alimentarius]|uniref:Ohr subfamily peroxiredoxin n=1 Tax=Virgibacillus alimentarius TaxID=698769 RepID=A0ABS4S3S8_9BACI|nr:MULTISPECIES: organic hydroperoxide resistance protein [Virgibacillus]MBP2256139.1 Ohr subfamily peroxiredoxin [Virgibacillus alimentarius]HLR66086.1 organic hydroperoxide resistance protein [Virgibacillus sp.]
MSNLIFTTSATATNGRDGHVRSDDGCINFKLVHPADKRQEGKEGSNPEQLFAAAYAACYDGALNLVASNQNKKINSETTAEVNFCKDQKDSGFKLAVTLNIHIEGISPEEAEELTEEAHQVCPYSKATRGNIEVTLIPKVA